MKKIIVLFFFLATLLSPAQQNNHITKADSIIALMTFNEKLELVAGYKGFHIKGVERLGIPPVLMADGPMGVRLRGKATAFPASIGMAASWNPDLVKQVGAAIGNECRSKNIGILLSPGVNMYRVPHCGRNFEYYGEDPCLVSETVVGFINGVQSEGTVATVKHLVANNQDYDRHRVSSNIDLRTLHEIYLPAFKASVQKAKVGAIMTSYNPLNGVHTSESEYLLKDVVRDEWGFEGIIMSDWISVYSRNGFTAGLDLEMPRPQFMHPDTIRTLIKAGVYNQKELDKKVRNILSTCYKFDLFTQKEKFEPDWEAHKEVSLQVAREAIVLLKNQDGLLPLKEPVKKIAVIGPNANYTPYSGGGAAEIVAYEMVSFAEGIAHHALQGMKVDYISIEGLNKRYAQVHTERFVKDLQRLTNYDVVIACVGFDADTEGEGYDRPFGLPEEQNWLIDQIAEINSNLIVTINAGGAVAMPWIDKVKTLLHAWYPGQNGAIALGEIIFGKISPSGKLPITIEKQWKDNAAYESYDSSYAVPGAKPFWTLYGKSHEMLNLDYTEGIFTGYRHYDKNDIEPRFPFGYGLSYTTFELSDFIMNRQEMDEDASIQLNLTIENTGEYSGAEVIQLYIHDVKSTHPRPVKELKSFKKITLDPGQQKKVSFTITPEMLQYYHPDHHKWIVEEGFFDVMIGTSSRDIKYTNRFILNQNRYD